MKCYTKKIIVNYSKKITELNVSNVSLDSLAFQIGIEQLFITEISFEEFLKNMNSLSVSGNNTRE